MPISFGIAVFLNEVCPTVLRGTIASAVELLAGIPSIIYGMWGLFVFVPFMSDHVQPWLIDNIGPLPVIGILFDGPPLGIGMLTAGIILAVMVIPFISSVMRDVFALVPTALREAAFGVGATRWEVVRGVVVPYTRTAVVGGIFLGLGRALGETMAVTFVLGNAHQLSASLLEPGNSIAAAIANEFTEADSEMYLSSLIALGVPALCRHLHRAGVRETHAAAFEPQRRKLTMPSALARRRKIKNIVALGLATIATGFGLIWLVWILVTTLINGLSALNLKLFTEMTPPPGSDGGVLNAIYGSAAMIVVAVLLGGPIGILAGTYLAEYGKRNLLAEVVRFVNDILLSAPSIVIGLFVYELVVRPSGHFSGWAGAVALAFILLPVVVRTTDETLRLMPITLREATLALGSPQWRMIVQVLYPAAQTGIVTGLLLGIARISGETAPLLFTALNNQYFTANMSSPMANIPVVIFQLALAPYDAWHALAWAGALLMTLFVLIVSVGARFLLRARAN